MARKKKDNGAVVGVLVTEYANGTVTRAYIGADGRPVVREDALVFESVADGKAFVKGLTLGAERRVEFERA